MSITVKNSSGGNPVVTLFGLRGDGTYAAARMHEDEVPYPLYWDDAVDQVMVYVEPDDEQLDTLLFALNDGKLEYKKLQDYGSAGGGKSEFPV